MSRIPVWDLPTRLFRCLFTGAVLGALAIALVVDDDSTIFQVHMLLGLVAGFVVLLRLVWGGSPRNSLSQLPASRACRD